MRTRLLFIASILMLFAQLLFLNETKAVPADPDPVAFTQPGGSIINIIIMGDEKVKWAKTLDGYPIMFNNAGVYEYAVLNNNYDMVPSGVIVNDILNRTTDEIIFLQTASKDISYSKSQINLLKGIWDMNQKTVTSAFPTTGSRNLVCILVGFSDLAFTKTQSDFNNLFNQVGYTTGGATGSVKDYYLENSYNQFNLTVTVAGPYTASHPKAYYGANTGGNGTDIRPRDLVTEAVNLANPSVNYANFDNNADGSVDAVYVIYAGYGEEAGGGGDCIWAHAWNIPTVTLDGKTISKYSCSPELRGASGSNITRIGVICHEFGHVLGSLDYYDTNYTTGGSYTGTGNWDVMAGGCWNNSGATPAHHNAYTKTYVYNWATPIVIASNLSITLNNAAENSNSFYRYNTPTTNEYFLIENRQQLRFDSNIPGHGMIIYHVDQSYINTAGNYINAGSHQGMYPVCANATANPPADYGTINGAGCAFPGTGLKTSFSDVSTPNSLSWLGAGTNQSLGSIAENTLAKTVTLSFIVLVPVCNTPISVTSSAVTSSTANISWTAASPNPANGYQYEVRTSGSPGSGNIGLIVTGSTSNLDLDENISGLNPATTYHIYVRSDCGSSNYSDWTAASSFSTSSIVSENIFTLNISDGVNSDETAVGFWPAAFDTYDIYDSEKILNIGSLAPQIFTLSSDSIETAINGQSELTPNDEHIIPLGFSTSVAGTFTFNATNLNDFDPATSVHLEDVQMGLTQDLRQNSSYTFTSGIVNNATRFKLHFGNNITTGISSSSISSLSIFTANDIIYVNIPEAGNGTIELFDMTGNRILSQQSITGLNKLLANLSKGIYIVKVKIEAEIKTQKVFIAK